MKRRRICVVVLAFLLVFALPGIIFAKGEKESSTKPGDEQYRIGMAVCTLGEAFWEATVTGARNAADDVGVELIVQSAQNNMNEQIQQIENFIAQEVDAIICAPVDVFAILESVKKCNEAGIPFIFNTRVTLSSDDAKVDYGVGWNMQELAGIGAQKLVDVAKENNTKVNVIEVLGALTDSHTLYCRDGFASVVEKNPEYIEVVTQVPGDWVPDKALSGTTNALKAHPEANCIYFHSDFYFPAIESSLKQVNRWKKIGEEGHVHIICPGGEKQTLDAMKDSYVDYILVFPNLETGDLSVRKTVELLDGKTFSDDYYLMTSYVLSPENFDEKSSSVYGYVWSPK